MCVQSVKSWFSGRGWGQQLFSFQSPAVHWIARTSSLNCLSFRNPYQTPKFTELPPPFSLKSPFFTEKCFASPSQKSAEIVHGSTFPAAKRKAGSGMLRLVTELCTGCAGGGCLGVSGRQFVITGLSNNNNKVYHCRPRLGTADCCWSHYILRLEDTCRSPRSCCKVIPHADIFVIF